MTDYSDLPRMSPTAILNEEPWLRLPSWRVLFLWAPLVVVCWFNVFVLAVSLSECYRDHFRSGRSCGSRSPFDVILEVSPVLSGLNLLLWAACVQNGAPYRRLIKLAALVCIILWLGVGGGIMLGRSLPTREMEYAQQTSFR